MRSTGARGWFGLGAVFMVVAVLQAAYVILVVIDLSDRALVFRVLKMTD